MNFQKMSNIFTPDYNQLTGLLKFLNTDELKSILNDDERTIEMISDLKQVKDIEAEKEMLIASNKSISEYNLSQKSVIQEYRENLDSTYRRAVELKDNLLAAKNAIESKPAAQSKDTLLALLQTATSEIEEEAEATVDAFLRKDLSVEAFLEKYLELRKIAHLRRIKSEKLISIIHDNGNEATPVKPQRLRKPPAPPISNNSTFPHKSSSSPYPSDINAVNQNIPVPSRPAPQPPPVPTSYPNSSYTSPFAFYSPYPVPSQYPNYPPF